MSPELNQANIIGFRCLIKGRFTTKSFLHIGSEKPAAEAGAPCSIQQEEHEGVGREELEEQGTPSSVVTGHNGQAIIPASAMRGAIRSRLMRLCPEKLAISLMGSPEAEGDTEDSRKKTARRLFIQTATIIEPCLEGPIFDDTLKCVDRIAMTAMSRWRRAPQNGMLRTVEAVPPGVTFAVTIGLCGSKDNNYLVTKKEVSAVLSVLGHFDQGNANTGFSSFQLGAFQKAGWGKVEWKTCQVLALTKNALDRWLQETPDSDHGGQGWGLCTEPVDMTIFPKHDSEAPPEEEIHLALTLNCKSTFFTADQRSHTKRATAIAAKAAKEGREESPEKLAKVMRVNGRAWLSGQSLKGVLRSQFERILRTRGIYCCDPSWEDNEADENVKARIENEKKTLHTGPRCPPIQSAREVSKLCPACQVFGAGGWASTIELSPFQEDIATEDQPREFLAISRFTGGGRASSQVQLGCCHAA